MVMKTSTLHGCCVSKNFYDLGNAHGHPRYKNKEAFAKDIIAKSPASINIAITNINQDKEREYLEFCGFHEATKNDDYIRVHVATSKEIREALAELTKEEEKRKREAALKRQEEYRKQAEERVKRLKTGRITVRDLYELRASDGYTLQPREFCMKYFGFSPKFQYNGWGGRDMSWLARRLTEMRAERAEQNKTVEAVPDFITKTMKTRGLFR